MGSLNWSYNNFEFTADMIGDNYGFVYQITNTLTNRKYIGKKFFYSSKSKQVKGKRRKYLVNSDWETYYGSNAELLGDVKAHGPENFKREILHLCENKSACSYLEAKEQFIRGALELDEYYNSWIMIRVRKVNVQKGLKC